MEAVTIEHLSFRYPQTDTYALKDISLCIPQGAFVTVCGFSGSGKSTLLKLLKPSLSPHGNREGVIYYSDKELSSLSHREECEAIGFVQQSPDAQLVTDKVWHELAFGLESLGLDNATIRRRVAETADFFGISAFFEKNVYELSGGQKQLLNLASVMAMNPRLLILDEPTCQLDPIAASEFLTYLRKVNLELGVTVILSEHRLEEVFSLSDKVIVLENGKLLSYDTPEKTGSNLQAQHNTFALALPAPMRIWHAVGGQASCPVTVAQGREWLTNFCREHTTYPLPPEREYDRNTVAVAIQNAWFRYEKNSPDILQNLSLQVYEGEFLAILGGNGAGKSTLLSIINGIHRPYRGKCTVIDAPCMTLPQNPQALLSGNSVLETLSEVFDTVKCSKEEQAKRIADVLSLCNLEHLAQRHPFDLSGGEQQRTALAKVLLLQPRILLLDEPTKGFDAVFKQMFARILKSVLQTGTTVVMVSHDVEFCARYSYRCAMLFHGEIVSVDSPRKFFSENRFYVTSSAQMSQGILEGAVTCEDVIYCCVGQNEKEEEPPSYHFPKAETTSESNEQKTAKLSLWRRLLAAFGGAALLFGVAVNLEWLPFIPIWQHPPLWLQFLLIAVPTGMLMVAFANVGQSPAFVSKRQKLPKRTAFAAALIILAIPLTVFVGTTYLDDQKYLFISLLVLAEGMFPFFLIFEGRKPQARELVLIAVLCALTVAGRTAFAALPQFKPVLALVIISGIGLGGESGFIVGAVSMLVSNIYFGQGAWTPWQMFAAGIIGLLAGVLFRKGWLRVNRGSLCIFGFIVTVVIYGGIMNFSSMIIARIPITTATLIAYYTQGLPMDLIHAFATSAILFFLAQPMLTKLNRVKIKYGLT